MGPGGIEAGGSRAEDGKPQRGWENNVAIQSRMGEAPQGWGAMTTLGERKANAKSEGADCREKKGARQHGLQKNKKTINSLRRLRAAIANVVGLFSLVKRENELPVCRPWVVRASERTRVRSVRI